MYDYSVHTGSGLHKFKWRKHLQAIESKKIFTEQVNLGLGFESMEFGSAEKGKEKLLGKRCQNNSVQLSLDGGHQGSCP